MKGKMLVAIGAIAVIMAAGIVATNASYVETSEGNSSAPVWMHGLHAAGENHYAAVCDGNGSNGNGDGDCENLTEITGVLSQDGRYFYINETRLSFGPYWYISLKEASYDYDGDGTTETILEELQGLVGTTVTVEGCLQDGILGEKFPVFYINDMLYREPGKPFWAGGRH